MNEADRMRAYLNASKRPKSIEADDLDFRDVESLVELGDMDGLIGSVLNRDANLKELLTSQDAELDGYMDGFIAAHCDEAENLCSLYNQVSECENKLNEFEDQIREFLDRLTETADEVVQMQKSTEDLHVRVQNRKAVKAEITLVYEAIMECGKFCDDIVRREVDSAFLHEMKAYDAKLSKWNSLLETNAGLAGSAVDLEISPRLAVAAQRVGDKLQRHMQTRFDALQDPGINIVLHQQIMESTGQHAYRFLAAYNKPVAESLKSSYLYIISEVHTKNIKAALKDVLDAIPYASLPYEALLPTHVLKLTQNNSDVAVQKNFFQSIVKAFGGQQAISGVDGNVVAEAAACGMPPLSSVNSSRFYLREDEYLAEFVATNELSSLPSKSAAPSASQSAAPLASPSAARRSVSMSGTGGGGGASSGLGSLTNGLTMKSLLNKLGGQSTFAKELSSTPFSNPKDLRATTFENQIHALRSVHILEVAVAAVSAEAGKDKDSHTPPLGVSPSDKKSSLSTSPLPAIPAALSNATAASASAGLKPPAATPPNHMGTVVLDPTVLNRLAKTDSWAIRFIVLLTSVVNAITSERKFVRNFFLGHIRDTLRGDLEEEVILRSIFFQVLQAVESSLQTEIAALTDPIAMLVGLRSVELLKNFIFQCPSPNPIMLLSATFGCVSAALRDRLYKLLALDDASLKSGLRINFPALDPNQYPSLAGQADVVSVVQQDASFASTLTVHPIVIAVGQLTAKLHALNVLHLKGSYVDTGSEATTFDDTIEGTLRGVMGDCYTLISLLSNRFASLPSRIPALVFVIVNLGHILYRWLAAARAARGLPSTMPLLVAHAPIRPTAADGLANSTSDSTLLMLRAQLLFDDEDREREAKNTDAKLLHQDVKRGVASMSPSRGGTSQSRARCAPSQALSQLDQTLTDNIFAFIDADIEARSPSIQRVRDAVKKIESEACITLGASVSDSAEATSATPCPVDGEAFLKLATDFSSGWQDQLLRVKTNLRALFATTVMMMLTNGTSRPSNSLTLDANELLAAAEKAVGGNQSMRAALPHANAAVLSRAAEASELLKRVLHDYYHVIVETNGKLVAAARRYFPHHSGIQAKMIGHHALEHELQELLGAQ